MRLEVCLKHMKADDSETLHGLLFRLCDNVGPIRNTHNDMKCISTSHIIISVMNRANVIAQREQKTMQRLTIISFHV